MFSFFFSYLLFFPTVPWGRPPKICLAGQFSTAVVLFLTACPGKPLFHRGGGAPSFFKIFFVWPDTRATDGAIYRESVVSYIKLDHPGYWRDVKLGLNVRANDGALNREF